jgi:hypothetical protein
VAASPYLPLTLALGIVVRQQTAEAAERSRGSSPVLRPLSLNYLEPSHERGKTALGMGSSLGTTSLLGHSATVN